MGQELDEVEGPGKGRTCMLGEQADLRLGQSEVSQAGQEHRLEPDQLRLGEYRRSETAAHGGDVGGICHGEGLGSADCR